MTITANEFIKSEIAVWGEDVIDDLLDRGFEPTLLIDANGIKADKWSWCQKLLTQPTICATIKTGSPSLASHG